MFIVFCIAGVLGFIYWQFKMLKKYTLSYDKFQIYPQEGCISVNGQKIDFTAIDAVSVRPLQQPALYEKMLSKSANHVYMAEVIFHLKQGESVRCVFNYKGALYKALKQLEPVVPVQAPIESYKPQVAWYSVVLVFVCIVGIIMALLIPFFSTH